MDILNNIVNIFLKIILFFAKIIYFPIQYITKLNQNYKIAIFVIIVWIAFIILVYVIRNRNEIFLVKD